MCMFGPRNYRNPHIKIKLYCKKIDMQNLRNLREYITLQESLLAHLEHSG